MRGGDWGPAVFWVSDLENIKPQVLSAPFRVFPNLYLIPLRSLPLAIFRLHRPLLSLSLSYLTHHVYPCLYS